MSLEIDKFDDYAKMLIEHPVFISAVNEERNKRHNKKCTDRRNLNIWNKAHLKYLRYKAIENLTINTIDVFNVFIWFNTILDITIILVILLTIFS